MSSGWLANRNDKKKLQEAENQKNVRRKLIEKLMCGEHGACVCLHATAVRTHFIISLDAIRLREIDWNRLE
jgi:hypothetical protein